jgi:hypothetical protein
VDPGRVPGGRAGVAARRASGLAETADWYTLRFPETYVGYARGERRSDNADEPALTRWALAGQWTGGEEAAVLEAAAGSIAYRFDDVKHVVVVPS